MALILGLNAYHGDASACILKDGKLIAAVEEERFLRIKHWAGFPAKSIAYCLREANSNLGDLDIIAINSDPTLHKARKFYHVLRHGVGKSLILDRLKNASARKSLLDCINELPNQPLFNGTVAFIEHHLAHLSSAFHVSPFDESVVASVDGFGDFASGSWGVGRGVDIKLDGRVFYPHSLGAFYQAITQFIGFPHYGDEYKVMGLAPYGKPIYVNKMNEIVSLKDDGTYRLNLDYFIFHNKKVAYEWDNCAPSVGRLFSEKLIDLLGPSRGKNQSLTQYHMDLAASAQVMYEEALFHFLNFLADKYNLNSLSLAGGCGNNSVANGKIRSATKFDNVYVAASSGDAGGAIGAAFSAYFENNKPLIRDSEMRHAYLGPEFTNEQIKTVLDEKITPFLASELSVYKLESLDKLLDMTSSAICEGKVVGWFQGRMEWGPRALGNRSILGDPRRTDMKEILNLKIKRRESFRPFAPSILREHVSEWFEQEDEVPFMMKVLPVRKEKRDLIPAVTHVDGSGRLQTVYQKTNQRYYELINSFKKKTGVPILLNTSFNENEPVVCTPNEAVDCFLRTKMDILVLNDYFVSRNS